MALEKPEVSSENRGPGFVASQRKIIFTEGELLCVCVCVEVGGGVGAGGWVPGFEHVMYSFLLHLLFHNIAVFIDSYCE